MFVKICGLTDPRHAVDAVEAGADAIGINFAAVSPRRVTADRAKEIADAVRGQILIVGVFRDHLAHEVVEIAEEVGLDAAQLHGSETPSTTRRIHEQVPIVFRAMAAGDPQLASIDDHAADVVLLDAPTPGGGVPFDWSLVGDVGRRHRLLLAGGLRPDNVADAIAAVRPWGVDTASGVESAPGVKDRDAIRRFVVAAREAGTYDEPHPPLTPTEEPA